MVFRIEWKKSTRKDFRKLPPRVVDRIIEAWMNWRMSPSHLAVKSCKARNMRIGFALVITA